LTYEEAMTQIRLAKKAHGNSDLFGHEKDENYKQPNLLLLGGIVPSHCAEFTS
jgi:hypothetical protein